MPGAPKPQNVFIPRDAGEATAIRRPGSDGLLGLFALIATVLFVVSGAVAIGVFLYKEYLESSSVSKLEQLNRAKAAFEPALIQELTRLDNRMRNASEVVGKHTAPSALFLMLEASTARTVSFKSLTFEATDPTRVTIRMDGVAESMNAIAFQADLFSKVGMVTSPIFSNIDRREDGVHFSFTALLNPTALNYAAIVRGVSAPLPEELPPPQEPAGPVSPFDAPPTEEVVEEGIE